MHSASTASPSYSIVQNRFWTKMIDGEDGMRTCCAASHAVRLSHAEAAEVRQIDGPFRRVPSWAPGHAVNGSWLHEISSIRLDALRFVQYVAT